MIYTMTLLPIPRRLGCDRKRYQSTVFKPRNLTPPRTKCELSHASECQTLSATKSEAKKAFLERNSQDK